MTKTEIQIIKNTIKEREETMLYYYKIGKETGKWDDHKLVSEAYKAVKELAKSLGIK